MEEDWAAVAAVVNEKMVALGLNQQELIRRSQLSKGTIREIQYNLGDRKRSPLTLEALSTALELHPQHLVAVLEHRSPPRAGEPAAKSADDLPGYLELIVHLLRDINGKIDVIDVHTSRIEQLEKDVRVVLEHFRQQAKGPDSPAE
ncbi:transcriptional regulator [Actinokineospora globicatena]|uniref:transcriptional regulator n=1 Tax=Actinokineospora globicatena TaxID=103729 RepID=UPI0020A3BA16|nr:transcriptional regulator [Actinokineospora globicatena]MCP2300699.1 hypothetical protein [Actinokineospora globicatena]GLW81243.1 hypothetical protein Aglo01_57240 [Actinokineospora globicatena]GLW89149.1 hypothetical protein Aglo02_67880 [Actinokineospora globicatena]